MVTALLEDRYRPLWNLYSLLRDIDRLRRPDSVELSFRERLVAVQRDVVQMVSALRSEHSLDNVRERMEELAQAVRDFSPKGALPDAKTLQTEWVRFRKQVAPFYEACVHTLRRQQAVRVPSLRPTNFARSGVHLLAGAVSLAMLEFVLPLWTTPLIMAVVAGTCWVLEYKRRRSPAFNKKVFGFFLPIAHPREAHHVNSATWYATALFALSLFQSVLVGAIALVVLALGDPAAGMIGRRWGKTRVVNNRSVQGTAAFALVGMAASCLVVSALHPEANVWPANIILGAAAGIVGAGTELFSRRIDDNFTIPVAVGACVAIVGSLLGLPVWG